MNVNSTTTLELNALYGEMTSNITQIKNIDLLKKMNEMIKNFISKAHTSLSSLRMFFEYLWSLRQVQ